MGNLFDLLNTWSQKLTYRILSMSGASETAKENYLKAVQDKNNDIVKADEELSRKLPTAKLLAGLAIFAGVLIMLKVINNRIN